MTTPRLIIHALPGVGRHRGETSAPLMDAVLSRLAGDGWDMTRVTWAHLGWAAASGLDAAQQRLAHLMAHLTQLDELHDASLQHIGDALAYTRAFGGKVRASVIKALKPWRGVPDAVLVLIGHSWGGVVAYEALLDHQQSRPGAELPLGALVTMGAPLAQTWLGSRPQPLRFSRAASARPWLHLANPRDPLTLPLSHADLWGQIAGQIEDVRVAFGLTPLGAHTGYWDDDAVAEAVAVHVGALRRVG